MRFFHKIAEGVDVMPLMHAISRQPDLWNTNRFRTTFPGTPHAEVDDILIRYSDTEKCKTTTRVMGDDSNIWYPAMARLPQAKPIILDLMRRVEAYELGRVLVSRLRPGKQVLPHADSDGEYVQTRDRARYHIVLQGLPGSLYTTGDETVNMRTGEVWWFNALEVHHIVNNSADDRVHLILDVRTFS